MNAEQLIEMVSKMTREPWVVDYRDSLGHIKHVPLEKIGNSFPRTPTVAKYDIGIGEPEAENAAGICALRNYSIPIIESLLQRVAELEKDAGRYRWLRHGDNDELVMRSVADGGGSRPFDYKIDGCWLPRNHELDAAIDAAISNATPNVRDAGPTPYSGRTTRRDEG